MSATLIRALKLICSSLKTKNKKPATKFMPWQYSISGLKKAYVFNMLLSISGLTMCLKLWKLLYTSIAISSATEFLSVYV